MHQCSAFEFAKVQLWALAVAVGVWLAPAIGHATTIVVDTTAQATATSAADGKCSLAEAMVAANTDAAVDSCAAGLGSDVIQIPAGNYELLLPYTTTQPGDALPMVSSTITLQGPTAGTATLTFNAAASTLRLLSNIAPGQLTLENLTVTKGQHQDVIDNGAKLTIKGCTFQSNGNASDPASRNVITEGPTASLTVSDSKFLANNAVCIRQDLGSGTVSLDNVELTANKTNTIYLVDANLTVTNCAFDQNTALNQAGAIFVRSKDVTVTTSVSDSTFTNNSGTTDAPGVFRNAGAIVDIKRCTFDGNHGGRGGVLENTSGGKLTVEASTLSNNSADGEGGAFRLLGASGTVTLRNTTIANNTAGTVGGGIESEGQDVVLNNVTLSGNSAGSSGGGIGIPNNAGAGTFTVSNSVIAGNVNPTSSPECSAANGKFLISKGYNVLGSDTGCTFVSAAGDQVGTGGSAIDPKLSSLSDNGGSTQTLAPQFGSPAIDKGNPASSGEGACEPVDQTGATRPLGAACDVGALELSPDAPDAGAGGSAGSGGGAAGTGGGSGGGAGAGGGVAGSGGGVQADAGLGGAPSSGASSDDSGGCGCRQARTTSNQGFGLLALAFALRRRRQAAGNT